MPEWISEEREKQFPFLNRSNYRKTSEQTGIYNCAAYVLGVEDVRWQPPSLYEQPGTYWPPGVPENLFVSSFVKAYETHGFSLCGDGLEPGYEKIALYAYSDGFFAHVAVQYPNGKWRSKLGTWEDIEHDTLGALEGESPAYGYVIHLMKRSISDMESD